ncbi:glutaminyl-peptide cyclotransferase [Flaviaesturariibacter flavus]|uniref:Glutaminyl-peptide cyclotransferase n=1 Tax=Flaviaesturariibacter flavus TaxID=2502780 RepID=A0A4R1BPS1_9BACT|nr:glutaminyl-peptide cyclotransferase [Flaviaesturariibacter flavus]TCJ19649.1 glutaminyl-peptide cyclotransferase [Flaviaesturariibacter flavus]
MKRNLIIALILIVVAAFVYNAFRNGSGETGTETTNPTSVENSTTSGTPQISYTVAGAYPHDVTSFTEGLSFYKGELWESTGENGKSWLLQVDLASGARKKAVKLDEKYFGEGVIILRDTIYQLTYKEKTVLVYDAKTLQLIKSLPLAQPEGWGLTTDGTNLIASDGSSNLYYYEPGTFRLLRTQGVTENNMPVSMINELEYINGFIYANVWQTNEIVKIDAGSGQIVGRMDLSQLAVRAKAKNPNVDVLNGIAYNPDTKKFYVTGKNWPELYELTLTL